MPIAATNPTNLSADFGLWAFTFRTAGDGLADFGAANAQPIAATAVLVKYRLRDDGVEERSPLDSDRIVVHVPDLYALAATDPMVATAIQALIAAVESIARGQGKL